MQLIPPNLHNMRVYPFLSPLKMTKVSDLYIVATKEWRNIYIITYDPQSRAVFGIVTASPEA